MTSAVENLNAVLGDRYLVERELGSGGMATVYLARDVRHDRKVAVKVLRPGLASVIGPQRFLQEIKTTASLQHPHILPLHDSGVVDGTVFYVMPFVAGESLRQRLNREKQLPVAEAVRITSEVATALDYAHRHGVVHRDIKPENILLQDGHALVADFGIALALSEAGGSRMTDSGIALGTPQYMSPEQAMGDRSLDARTDVYALGCVLYEMLVGGPPFSGPNAQAITAKVLSERPAPIRAHRDTVPEHIEAAIRCALARLPADRFTTAESMAEALKAAGNATPMPRLPTDPRWRWVAGGLTVALASTLMIAGWGWRVLRKGANPLRQYAIALPSDQSLAAGLSPRFALSPDGSRFAYVGPAAEGTQLWLRERDQLEARPIAGTRDAAQPVFSPDGQQVAFITLVPTAAVNVVALGGGLPVRVANVAGSTIESGGVAWGTDGYLYASGPEGLVRVPATGGALETVTVRDSTRGESRHLWPDVLPDGRSLLFTIRYPNRPFDVAVADLRTGRHRTLVRGSFARFASPGHLLYSADGVLVAAPFDPTRVAITGPAIPFVEGVGDIAVAPGTLLYVSARPGLDELVRVARDGATEVIDSSMTAMSIEDLALSPDGTRLALRKVEDGRSDVWIKQLDRGRLSRLTYGGHMRPQWTADGSLLTFVSTGTDRQTLWIRSADGGEEPRLLYGGERNISEGFLSPDGSWIVIRTNLQDPGGGDILALRRGVDSVPRSIVATEFEEVEPSLSPDGRWLAYVSNEAGPKEVFVRPFPDAASARWQVSAGGGMEPVWAPSGNELFYRNGLGQLVMVELQTAPRFVLGQQRVLLSAAAFKASNTHAQYAVIPGGRGFLMIRPRVGPDRSVLVVLDNWLAALGRQGAK